MEADGEVDMAKEEIVEEENVIQGQLLSSVPLGPVMKGEDNMRYSRRVQLKG